MTLSTITVRPVRALPRSLLLGAALSLLALSSCDGGGGGSARFAYVTNGVDPFWNVAGAGARAAAEEFDVEVDLVFPEGGAVDQKQKVEDLLVRGVDGIAISPVDGENMVSLINDAAEKAVVITHDSDAPGSNRRCFIGVDNYECGRACGDLLREALPNGGKVALFVGRFEQDNAQLRRQGVIDSLLGRAPDSSRRDALDATPSGNGFSIVATRTDGFDKGQAKANAEDVLVVHPDLAGMVGLFAYNAPACLEALRGKDALGEVEVVSFDEQAATLDGIEGGHLVGTVSQNPYQYGYHSIRILQGLARGDESVLPEGGVLRIEPTVVTKVNVAEFRKKLDRDLADGGR